MNGGAGTGAGTGGLGGTVPNLDKIDLGFGFNILSLYMSMNVPSIGNTQYLKEQPSQVCLKFFI
ncbi:hypothetical protein IMG5_009930 [Ichthyophthirius multifiliis]|uniref:Uncharacterized protein n=1 Tax=Ichthyophthirius multifiliis TaxID=5932 RepID=G0QJX0_ICHMU|nr:hypothetical protein IMG5_009930 [Ichthyophthirius multifiliis]EGR34486.1 hypothetical protein IMG5_009930 [Ichthyophthirius multifiliis]|eukprot:XP_004039790.1 hypothetical protein IMG5_009930 [Ichthyophthirius multifiliis]